MLHNESFHTSHSVFPGWRVRLAKHRGIPTPAIYQDVLYVGGGFGSYEFYSFDCSSGEQIWRQRTSDDGPTAAIVQDDHAIFNTESCTLEAVDTSTGKTKWSHWLGDPLLAQPAADIRNVYMAYPANGGHFLGAFRLHDGQPLWKCEIGHDVITAPIVCKDTVYLSTFDGQVWAIRTSDGGVEWNKQMRATSAPWISDGKVYVSHRDSSGRTKAKFTEPGDMATDEDGPNGASWERTSRFETDSGVQGHRYAPKFAQYLKPEWGESQKSSYKAQDASVGFGAAPASAKIQMVKGLLGEDSVSRAWRFQGSRPVVIDGVLYDTTGDMLEARDAESGQLIWSWQEAASQPGERRLTPPAVSNGRIWAGTWDGRIISWNALYGSVRWEVQAGAPCHWQPAICGGRIFAGLEDGSLISFSTGDDQDDGWPMWGGGPGHNGKEKKNEI